MKTFYQLILSLFCIVYSNNSFAAYCIPGNALNSTSAPALTNVTIGSINNQTNFAGVLYNDYSSSYITNVTSGQTYPMSITSSNNNGYWAMNYFVYVDLNADQDFDDPGEKLYQTLASTSTLQVFSFNISIAFGLASSSTRMRIISAMGYYPFVMNPCPSATDIDVFQVDDYGINITGSGAQSCTGPGVTLTNETGLINDGSGTASYSNNQNCTWTIAPPNATSVSFTFSAFETETNNDVVKIYNGTTLTAPNLLATYSGTTFPANPTVTASSGIMTVVFTSNANTVYNGFSAYYSSSYNYTYCTTNLHPSCTGNKYITRVEIEGTSLYSNTQCDGAADGYKYFPPTGNKTAVLYKDSLYHIIVNTNVVGQIIDSWIDYNHNNLFESFEYMTISHYSSTSGPNNSDSYFRISKYAPTGLTRIRIRTNPSFLPNGASGSCDYVNEGETEDYEVTILPGLNCNTNLNQFCNTLDEIHEVKIVGTNLDNVTTCSGDGYSSFIQQSASYFSGSLIQGQTYSLGVTVAADGDKTAAWIDYNQDGIFNANEYTLVSNNTTANIMANVNISVPANAPLGVTHMRIRCRYNANINNSDACTFFNDGETEDYKINITEAPALPVANFSASAVNITVGDTVYFTDLTSNFPSSWHWYFSGASISAYNNMNQNPFTRYDSTGTYSVKLVVSNPNGTDTLFIPNYITVNPVSPYCIPSTPGAATALDYIAGVAIGSIFNTAPTTISNPYSDFTNLSINLTIGSSINLEVQSGTDNVDTIAAWIDYNHDGDFTDVGEKIGQLETIASTTYYLMTVNVPLNALPGATRMRVRIGYYSYGLANMDPCQDYEFGETEDYTIVLIPSGGPGYVAFNANNTTIQAGTQVTFTDASTNNPSTWNWSFSGGSPASSSTQNPVITYSTPGTYSVTLTAGNGSTNYNSYITVLPVPSQSACNEIFFSEYVEGLNSNQALEIYNPSATAINLSNYAISIYSNGSTMPVATKNLVGTLAAHTTRTFVHTGAVSALTNFATGGQNNTICNFNGNDAIALKKDGFVIDVIGQIGVNPVTGWTVGAGSTANNTLVRNQNIGGPSASWATVQNQWTVLPVGTYSNIGSNTNNCYSVVVAPVADFTANTFSVNAGQSVNFTDLSTNAPTSWSWTFTGATPATSTAQNPSNITYNSPGCYQVSLTATNSAGSNTKTMTCYITVTNSTPYCIPAPVNGTNFGDFINSVTLGTISNLNTGAVSGPAYSNYTNLSTNLSTNTAYNIVVQNGTYTNDTIAAWIDYNNDGDFADAGEKLDQVSAPIINSNYTLNFTVPGNVTLGQKRLRVRIAYLPAGAPLMDPCTNYNYGETEDYSVNIVAGVVITPVANFTANTFNINAGQSVNFTDLSTNNPTSWTWTFTGATPATSTAQNPSNITYNTPGCYQVSLTATNSAGSNTSTQTCYINVTNPVITPVANFTANTFTINTGQSVNFTDLSTNNPTSWTWTFTGATPASSTTQNPSNIVYNTPGCYQVSLTATNSAGSNTKTMTCYITVNAIVIAPIANFTASSLNITTGQSVNFTDLSTNNPTSWSWTFTGATPASNTLQNPTSITYNTAGCYQVSLTATNSAGSNTSTQTCYITVTNPVIVPVANFTASSVNITTGQSINFTDLSTNNPSSWNWVFTGATPASSTTQNPSNITYNTPGCYQVSLTATNSAGSNTSTQTCYITVVNPVIVPVAGFNANTQFITVGQSVNFTDLSSNNPTSWSWSFTGAAPASSTLQNPSNITYNNAGCFEVVLTATNSAGSNTSTQTCYINVVPAGIQPQASFSINPNPACTNSVVSILNTSTNALTFVWDMPGATPSNSTDQFPMINYAVAGTYQIKLVAINGVNSDTIIQTITVDQSPTVVAFADMGVCLGSSVTIDATAMGNVTYAWTPDATLATPYQSQTVATPTSTTDYVITVTDNLCSGSDTLTVTVWPLPVTPVITQVGNILYATAGFPAYQWYLNNVPIPASMYDTLNAISAGDYTVTAVDTNGCISAASPTYNFVPVAFTTISNQQISIYPNPTSNILYINLPSNIQKTRLEIIDAKGKLVLDEEINANSTFVSTEQLSTGMYFIRFINANEVIQQKFIKN